MVMLNILLEGPLFNDFRGGSAAPSCTVLKPSLFTRKKQYIFFSILLLKYENLSQIISPTSVFQHTSAYLERNKKFSF